jgi:hypothetical protein
MIRSALMVCGGLLVATAAPACSLQPVNEQLRDGDDPWLWVREQVAAK